MQKQYFLTLDVEGAGELDCAFVYDFGGAVCDRNGKIYEHFSFVISEIFDEKELMASAYYAKKLPQYVEGLRNGTFVLKTLFEAKNHVRNLIKQYGIKEVFAYNASYDKNALNNTQRWLTKSKYRWFFPYGVKVNCIWHMACQVICTQKRYRKFIERNGFLTAFGNMQTSAEIVYAYISKVPDFQEQHTGYEDVKIEVAILAHCFRQKKKMKRNINRWCWRIPQTPSTPTLIAEF